jgi:hypothetical protein
MAQQGNTYTGKFADMPTYLTRNHMYLAYDTLELYGFDDQHNPYKLAPSNEVSVDDVREIINNYLDAGDGVTINYNSETGKLEISGQNLTTDHDLYIDSEDVIRNNITEFTEVFWWKDGDPQRFVTEFDMIYINELSVNGVVLIRDQFETPFAPENEFEILDPLDDGDCIHIKYKHYIKRP